MELVRHADISVSKLVMLGLSSRARGSRSTVRRDVKRMWAKFNDTRVFRRLEGALWVHGNHGVKGRPHIHVLAVVPQKLPLRQVRKQWKGGISHARLVTNVSNLADYFASQARAVGEKDEQRQRVHGFRAPPNRAP